MRDNRRMFGELAPAFVGEGSVGVRPARPPNAHLTARRAAMTAAGFRRGVLVRRRSGGQIVAIESVDARSISGFDVVTGYGVSASPSLVPNPAGGPDHLCFEVVYAPREGFVHPLLAVSRGSDESSDKFRARRKAVVAHLSQALSDSERCSHPEHGEFWSREAVARHLALKPD